jgi:hypothetical protein
MRQQNARILKNFYSFFPSFSRVKKILLLQLNKIEILIPSLKIIMSKLSTVKKGRVVKRMSSLYMDAELMDRLQAVAKKEKVGFSRVAENCIRGYLPVYEFIDRLRQEKSIAEFGKTNPIPFVHPDILFTLENSFFIKSS